MNHSNEIDDKCTTVIIDSPSGPVIKSIKIRPYAKEFIKEMSKHFEVGVWTASTTGYASAVVKLLDPEQKYIEFVMDRRNCLRTAQNLFIKDLRLISNRNIENMILLDNGVYSFAF